MQRLTPFFRLFVLTFVLGGFLQAASVHAADEKGIDAKPDAPKAGPAKAPVQGGPKDGNARWWDDPKIVKALSLTDEQRQKMGEYLKAYRKNVLQDRKPEAFHEALVQGDWKDARIQGDKLAKAAETSVRTRGAFKIDVLSVLNKEQREMLVDQYPRLIYKPWRRAMRGTSPR